MAMTVQLNNEPEYLRATLAGEFSLDEAKRTFFDIVEAARRLGIDRIVIDGLAVTGVPQFLERFDYAQFTAELSVLLSIREGFTGRFAYVMRIPLKDPGQFGETVAVNRGMNVKVFDNLEDAVRWLRGPLQR